MERTRGFEIVTRCIDDNLKLPERSTTGSAGYDIYTCEDIVIPSIINMLFQDIKDEKSKIKFVSKNYSNPTLVKTGIKVYMPKDEVFQLYLRSSSPRKFGLIMSNSVGIIDSDYYNNPSNEGEIGFLVYNISAQDVFIEKGTKFGQGIFTKYYTVDNDKVDGIRTGGFGSTD